MAVCRRCGTVFDYNKWDGVCPKCCMYNRPEGSKVEDECWMDNYNVDDNSYRLPQTHVEHVAGRNERSASRHNAYDAALKPTDKVNVQRQPAKKRNAVKAWVVIVIYIIVMAFFYFLRSLH